MRRPLLLALLLAVGTVGCDWGGPSESTADLGVTVDVEGSVFVVDPDDGDNNRSSGELGIANVLVEIVEDGEVIGRAVTDSTGRYATTVSLSSDGECEDHEGDECYDECDDGGCDDECDDGGCYDECDDGGCEEGLVVRIPVEADTTFFNDELFTYYDYADEGPAEQELSLDNEVLEAEFGFVPDRNAMLAALQEGGPFQTAGSEVDSWRHEVILAMGGTGCTVCYDEMRGYLDAIFFEGGSDYAFGNPIPFFLPSRTDPVTGVTAPEDPFLMAITILTGLPTSVDQALRAELFAAELNFLSGRGSGNDTFDRTLLFYLEEAAEESSDIGRRANGAEARLGDRTDLSLARAFNRGGGGGGGPVGEN